SCQEKVEAREWLKGGRRYCIGRIGSHHGDLLQEGEDLFGSGVNVASRIQLLASPGGSYGSSEIYQQVRNHRDVSFRDLGERQLRNIKEPIRIYDLVPSEGEVESRSPEAPTSLR